MNGAGRPALNFCGTAALGAVEGRNGIVAVSSQWKAVQRSNRGRETFLDANECLRDVTHTGGKLNSISSVLCGSMGAPPTRKGT